MSKIILKNHKGNRVLTITYIWMEN